MAHFCFGKYGHFAKRHCLFRRKKSQTGIKFPGRPSAFRLSISAVRVPRLQHLGPPASLIFTRRCDVFWRHFFHCSPSDRGVVLVATENAMPAPRPAPHAPQCPQAPPGTILARRMPSSSFAFLIWINVCYASKAFMTSAVVASTVAPLSTTASLPRLR